MNLRPLLPPAAALLAGGVWLGHLASSRTSLSNGNHALEQRIAAAGNDSAAEHPPTSAAELRTRGGHPTANGKQLPAELREWKILAESLVGIDSGSIQNLRMNLRLQSRLKKMSATEILTTFDELAAAGVSREGLSAVERMFFDAAAEKDPQLTLRHFESALADGDHPLGGPVSTTFGRWLGKDPAQATAWLDEMTAAGKFETKRLDGVNQTLLNCAGPVIASLLGSSPADALARLQSLPEERRLEVLKRNCGVLKPGEELAFATLVRQGLPEGQRTDGFRDVATRMAFDQGFTKVGEFLDTIGASPEERQATARTAAATAVGTLLKENGQISDLHDWLVAQDPTGANRVTGSALATNGAKSVGFKTAAAMVAELHAKTGSDELLEAFLTNGTVSSRGDQAMVLANQIQDPALRERMQSLILLNRPKPADSP